MPWDPMHHPKLGAFCSAGSDFSKLIEGGNSMDLRRSKIFNFGDSIDIPQGSIERHETVAKPVASVPSLFKGLMGGIPSQTTGGATRPGRQFE